METRIVACLFSLPEAALSSVACDCCALLNLCVYHAASHYNNICPKLLFHQATQLKNYTGESEINATHAVQTCDVAVSPEFADGLYNSCKDVQFPSNNQKVRNI